MAITVVRKPSADEIPVIDLGPLRDGTAALEVGQQLAFAASEVGFIYVRNHGVAQTTIARAREVGLTFFRQAEADKLKVRTNQHHHGYLRPGATRMYDNARADIKESYNFGLELTPEQLATPEIQNNPWLGPNEWPASIAGFKEALYRYFEQATVCAEAILRGFALAGGHDEELFISRRDLPVSRGSLQYYPPRPEGAAADHYSLAAHTDFGVLTLLAQDDLGGLQIQAANGEWIEATPVPDTLVVNVGDLLGRWSNNRYRSTPHRVMNTSGRERLSVVLAYDPNADSLVDPAPFCTPPHTPEYDPITCGDYLAWRFEKAFSYRKQ